MNKMSIQRNNYTQDCLEFKTKEGQLLQKLEEIKKIQLFSLEIFLFYNQNLLKILGNLACKINLTMKFQKNYLY